MNTDAASGAGSIPNPGIELRPLHSLSGSGG